MRSGDVVSAPHKATRTITLKIASLKIIILKIPFHILLLYISSCLSVIHPDSHFDTNTSFVDVLHCFVIFLFSHFQNRKTIFF